MKRKLKIILISGLVLVAVVVVPDLGSYYQQLKMLGERLPKEDREVPFFDGIKSNEQYEITRFWSNMPEYGLVLNDGTLVITTNQFSEERPDLSSSKWYKIDDRGNCWDSLVIKKDFLNTFDSYLFNLEKSYYVTWLSDSDTVRKPFVTIEEGGVLDDVATKKALQGADYATDYYTVNRDDAQQTMRNIIFLKNNIWYKMATRDRDFLPSYTDPQMAIGMDTIDFSDTNNPQKVRLNHFYKQYWYGNSFWNISFAVNGSKPEHWVGTGYFTMTLGHFDFAFKKASLDLYRGGTLGWYDLKVHESMSSKFALISMEDGREQYLIRWP